MFSKTNSIEEALKYGSAVATAKVTKKGTEAPTVEEVHNILGEIKIIKL